MADRQWFSEGVSVEETGEEEWFSEGVAVIEQQPDAAADTTRPFIIGGAGGYIIGA